MTIAERVLELARWAPSGDNSQPWRFRLAGPTQFDVLGYDTRAHCVYDLDGRASEFAHGMLLETIAIAASSFGARARITLPDESASGGPLIYRVALDEHAPGAPDPLATSITTRTVQRRPMLPRKLAPAHVAALERAAAPLDVAWFRTLPARRRLAALFARSAQIRLTIPEAYAVHRSVIEWHATTSADRMPDAALGADPILLAIMRRAMTSWARLDRVNRWTGTLLPRLALDYVPALACSAVFALIARGTADALADRIEGARATQRFWLTATSLGLQMQPQYTPLVFARYARAGRPFTTVERARAQARDVAADLERLLGAARARDAVWLGRVGPARSVPGRSLRLPLAQLVCTDCPAELPGRAA